MTFPAREDWLQVVEADSIRELREARKNARFVNGFKEAELTKIQAEHERIAARYRELLMISDEEMEKIEAEADRIEAEQNKPDPMLLKMLQGGI